MDGVWIRRRTTRPCRLAASSRDCTSEGERGGDSVSVEREKSVKRPWRERTARTSGESISLAPAVDAAPPACALESVAGPRDDSVAADDADEAAAEREGSVRTPGTTSARSSSAGSTIRISGRLRRRGSPILAPADRAP